MTRAATIEAEVAALTGLGLDDLRAAWRNRFGPAPKLRSPDLLRLMLAWRLQAHRLGGLDHDTRRKLGGRGPTMPEGRHLGTGAILRRDWQGQRIEVVIEPDGFRWDGTRFFGLREGAP